MNQSMSALDKKGIGSFIGLSFGLAWAVWIGGYWLGVRLGTPASGVLNITAAFSPAIAAYVVRRWVTREGFGDVGFKISLKSWPYFLMAWLMPLLIITGVASLAYQLQLTEINFSVAEGLKDFTAGETTQISFNLFVVSIMVSAVPATLVLFGEEFGWRGYLQKKLYWGSPWKSAVVTGLIWGIWHYPVNLQGYNFPNHPYWGLLVFPIACIFLSYIFAWFYRATGSIWSTCFAHAGFNTIAGSLMVVLYVNRDNFILTSIAGVCGIAILASVAFALHVLRGPDSVKTTNFPPPQ